MAEDTSRPLCQCHGEPMHANGIDKRRGGRMGYRCAVKKREMERNRHWNLGGREKRLARYDERKQLGLCTKDGCGRPSLTSSVCWEHLNDQEARDAVRI